MATTTRWLRHREPATGWLAITFGLLAAVLGLFEVLPNDPQGLKIWLVVKVSLCSLLLFPYCLYRFMASFEKPPLAIRIAARVLAGVVVVTTLLLPSLPQPGEQRPPWLLFYTVLIVVEWVFLSAVVAVRLWRAGRGLPTVARRRTQLLAAGAAVLATGIILSSATPSSTATSPTQIATQLVAIVSAHAARTSHRP